MAGPDPQARQAFNDFNTGARTATRSGRHFFGIRILYFLNPFAPNTANDLLSAAVEHDSNKAQL
jgi:hypothetical protein